MTVKEKSATEAVRTRGGGKASRGHAKKEKVRGEKVKISYLLIKLNDSQKQLEASTQAPSREKKEKKGTPTLKKRKRWYWKWGENQGKGKNCAICARDYRMLALEPRGESGFSWSPKGEKRLFQDQGGK